MNFSKALINILAFLPFILFFINIKFFPVKAINKDYLSISSGKALRGICSLCVIFHHMAAMSYTEEAGIFQLLYHNTGRLFVALFFFMSGFGLMRQHMNSEKYSQQFLIKRLPSVLIPFIFALIFYLVIEAFRGNVYSIAYFFEEVFLHGNLTPFVPYSWYIVLIVAFYIVFAIMMHVLKKHYMLMVLGGVIWYICHVVICRTLGYSPYWYLSAFASVIGMFFAVKEEEINIAMAKHYWIIAPAVWIVTILSLVYIRTFSLKYYATRLPMLGIYSCLFAVSIVLVLMKAQIGNKVTDFLGEISLEMYLFQGLWINHLYTDILLQFVHFHSIFGNPFLCTVLVITLTIATASVFHILNKKIIKLIRKRVIE